MTRLPWAAEDSPEPPGGDVEAAELTITAPTSVPPPIPEPSDVSLSDRITAAVDETASAAGRIGAAELATGGQVAIYTTTVSGQQIKIADAKNRAFRTLFQNMGVDLMVALGAVVPMLATMDFTSKLAWAVFGTSVAKTVINVFVSYVTRLTAEPVIATPTEVAPGVVAQPIPHATG